MANTIWVITGANRGIGLGLVKTLLARPSTTVIGTVRNAASENSLKDETANIALGQNSILHIIHLDFGTALPIEKITDTMTPLNPPHIDVLFANAGFSTPMTPALTTTPSDLRACFETNTIAPLLLFQALFPLLRKSPTGAPKFISISSSVGSIAAQEPLPGGAYGPSKAALNWLTRALHFQHERDGLVAVALHPGWVQTRMGDLVARDWEYHKGPPETVEGSVNGILSVVNAASREKSGGRFLMYTGEELPW
ncbi:SDR family oxidoreductase [Aspergillus stella-maris]|uniref:SDR family oxidoreductase n=1 Tax=Aspergillus stella-maris TaxID=1810926 RepID=UPI003CCC9D9E